MGGQGFTLWIQRLLPFSVAGAWFQAPACGHGDCSGWAGRVQVMGSFREGACNTGGVFDAWVAKDWSYVLICPNHRIIMIILQRSAHDYHWLMQIHPWKWLVGVISWTTDWFETMFLFVSAMRLWCSIILTQASHNGKSLVLQMVVTCWCGQNAWSFSGIFVDLACVFGGRTTLRRTWTNREKWINHGHSFLISFSSIRWWTFRDSGNGWLVVDA